MRVPSSQVKIQICKSIINFYSMELPGKLLSGKAGLFLFFNDPNYFEMPLLISYCLNFLYNYGYCISYIKYITLSNV